MAFINDGATIFSFATYVKRSNQLWFSLNSLFFIFSVYAVYALAVDLIIQQTNPINLNPLNVMKKGSA